VIALAVVYMAMDRLEEILIPFCLALALSYLLQPLIDCFSCRNSQQCFCKLPRGLAVLLSFMCAVAVLLALGLILFRAMSLFSERSGLYRERMEQVLEGMFTAADTLQATLGSVPSTHAGEGANHDAIEEATELVSSFVKDVSITDAILQLLGTAAHVAEDLMYITLFLVFMLAHAPSEDSARHAVSHKVERQIFLYIRGKASIAGFVGLCHSAVLGAVGFELWLPFGVVTFFLNFIPNVGGFGAVLLPMPLIALDPNFGPSQSSLAFLIPLAVNIFAKDVLEPYFIGASTRLHPVAVLLAILIFGSVWGITGMVMAIPLTAVVRIYLSSIAHPLAQALGRILSGEHDAPSTSHTELY